MKENGEDKIDDMYRVGDYVYFEQSGFGLYAIRRIEELTKTQNGSVEARVTCFYRRSEIPSSLLPLADKHHWGEVDVEPDSDDEEAIEKKQDSDRAKHKSRELFLSRQLEFLPVTLIRGKCSVTLLSEVETIASYYGRENAFFYSLVFDPQQKTLQADKGSIRIGSEFQAPIPAVGSDTSDPDIQEEEEQLWDPNNKLTEQEIEQFIIIARSVGTFARALDCSSSVKQPSLHMSAAAASRDITVFHAYQALNNHKYNMSSALSSLVPGTGPVLCRDEMEDWSSAEAALFEEAIEKCSKNFNDIKKDYLPWKSVKNIIEYFFMWKTTDRYVHQKKIKALESEHKLKQVFVPEYSRKSLRVTGPNGEVIVLGRDCDAYPKMTKYSWNEYKKYGRFVAGLTTDDCFIIDRSANGSKIMPQTSNGLIIEPGSPSKGGKTRAAFFLVATPLMKAARIANKQNRQVLRHHARRPNKAANLKEIRTNASSVLEDPKTVKNYTNLKEKVRPPMDEICRGRGQTDLDPQDWLVLRPENRKDPDIEAFPRPEKRSDGSYIYDKVPNVPGADVESTAGASIGVNRQQMFYKKRAYEERPLTNEGLSAPKVGRSGGQARAYSVNQVAPKGKVAMLTRTAGGQKTIISWQDAPDDLFFKANKQAKKMRKHLSTVSLRRAARKPFRKVLSAKA